MKLDKNFKCNEAIKNIETQVITKKQTPETDEAFLLLEMEKHRLKNLYLLPGVALLIVGALCLIGAPFGKFYFLQISGLLAIASLISFIVYFVCRKKFLRPYYYLLDIAIANDRIRHEERIRFRERKRLENEEENKIVITAKEEKRIEKNKQKDLEAMQKLEKENSIVTANESTLNVVPNRIILSQGRPAVPMKKSD